MQVDQYTDTQPKIDFFDYFEGNTKAWGLLQLRNGKVTRRFSVSMYGVVEEDVLRLEENFVFDDGETTQRIWVVQRTPSGGYIGQSDDLVGEARGEAAGMAVNWHYRLRLPVKGREMIFTFDDWLYALDERRAFNRAIMKKWGIRVAELSLVFEKL